MSGEEERVRGRKLDSLHGVRLAELRKPMGAQSILEQGVLDGEGLDGTLPPAEERTALL